MGQCVIQYDVEFIGLQGLQIVVLYYFIDNGYVFFGFWFDVVDQYFGYVVFVGEYVFEFDEWCCCFYVWIVMYLVGQCLLVGDWFVVVYG